MFALLRSPVGAGVVAPLFWLPAFLHSRQRLLVDEARGAAAPDAQPQPPQPPRRLTRDRVLLTGALNQLGSLISAEAH